jgi:hypothetical protein
LGSIPSTGKNKKEGKCTMCSRKRCKTAKNEKASHNGLENINNTSDSKGLMTRTHKEFLQTGKKKTTS